jgi:hypothetical protein
MNLLAGRRAFAFDDMSGVRHKLHISPCSQLQLCEIASGILKLVAIKACEGQRSLVTRA